MALDNSPDAKGLVPTGIGISRDLDIFPAAVSDPVTVTAVASNFQGGTVTFVAILVPIDAENRNSNVMQSADVILFQAPGQNLYTASWPGPLASITLLGIENPSNGWIVLWKTGDTSLDCIANNQPPDKCLAIDSGQSASQSQLTFYYGDPPALPLNLRGRVFNPASTGPSVHLKIGYSYN